MNKKSTIKSRLANISTFTMVCIGFAFLTIPAMFFEADLSRIVTPFLELFFFLFFILIYLILFVISLIYIFLRIKKRPNHALLPILVNVITFYFVFFLFMPFHNLRINVEFLIKKDRFYQVVQWVDKSIQNGEIVLEQNHQEVVRLPDDYRNVSDGDRVLVQKEEDVLNVYFLFGGGMFEYYPGFMFRSDNNPPPIENRDIECFRKIKPHWYYCS